MGSLIGDIMAAFGISGGASLASIQKMSATVKPEAMEEMAAYFDVGGNNFIASGDGMSSAVDKVVTSWHGQAATAASDKVLQSSFTSASMADSSTSASSQVQNYVAKVMQSQAKIAAVQPVDTSFGTAVHNAGGPFVAAMNPGAVAAAQMVANEKAEAHRQQAAGYLAEMDSDGHEFASSMKPFPPASNRQGPNDLPGRLSVSPIGSGSGTVNTVGATGPRGSTGGVNSPNGGNGPTFTGSGPIGSTFVTGPTGSTSTLGGPPGTGQVTTPTGGGTVTTPGGVGSGSEWTTPSVYSGTGAGAGPGSFAGSGGGSGAPSSLGLTASALVGGGGALLGAGGLAASGRGGSGVRVPMTPEEEALAKERALQERALGRGSGLGAAGEEGEFRSGRYGAGAAEEFGERGLGRGGSGFGPGGRGGVVGEEAELRGNRYGSSLAEEGRGGLGRGFGAAEEGRAGFGAAEEGHGGLGRGFGPAGSGMGGDETELRGNRYQGALGEEGGPRGAFGGREELPLRGAGAAGLSESQLAAGERGSMMPPGAGGGRRGDDEQELNRRPDYLVETDDIWGDGRLAAPSVLG